MVQSRNHLRGTLEGNGYEIHDLYNQNTQADFQGLFGYVENATIQNLSITTGNIQGGQMCGAIAGKAKNTKIMNCKNGIVIEITSRHSGRNCSVIWRQGEKFQAVKM